MGLEELLNTLKKKEQKQIDDIWQAAKNEAEKLRTQVAEAIADITKVHADKLASACHKSMRAIFLEAETRNLKKKLFAHQALDKALLNAAIIQLPDLRKQHYQEVFANLVEELPVRQWEKIIVNPKDLELAAKFFTVDTIHPEAAISGGFVAAGANGRIIVDNTFEKRLEKKWPYILPAIIAELEKRYGNSGSAEKN